MPKALIRARDTRAWKTTNIDHLLFDFSVTLSDGRIVTGVQRLHADNYDLIIISYVSEIPVDINLYCPLVACVYGPGTQRKVLHGVISTWSTISTVDVNNMLGYFTLGDIFKLELWCKFMDDFVIITIHIAVDKDDDRPARSIWEYHSTYGVGNDYPKLRMYNDLEVVSTCDAAIDHMRYRGVTFDSDIFSGCRYYVTIDGHTGEWLTHPIAQALTALANDETKAVIMSANI